jgi:hypothetical protein
MAMPRNMIEQAWEIYRHHTEGNGVQCTDIEKFHWLCGFAGCLGVLNGTLPVGIREGTLTFEVAQALQNELELYRAKISELEVRAKIETDKRNKH